VYSETVFGASFCSHPHPDRVTLVHWQWVATLGVQACAVPVCVWFCVLLTSETVVHLYRHNVCGDAYIDTMYCMWRCVHVLAWLNAPVLFLWMTTTHKLLKDLYFFVHFLHFFKSSTSVIQSSVGPVELSEKKQIYVYCLCMSVCA